MAKQVFRRGKYYGTVDDVVARIEALEAQLKAAQDRDIAGLQQVTAMARAMDHLLASPKGVVPPSAERFYDSVSGRFFGISVMRGRSRI